MWCGMCRALNENIQATNYVAKSGAIIIDPLIESVYFLLAP